MTAHDPLLAPRSFTASQRRFVTTRERFPAFVGGFGSGKTAAAMGRAMRLKIACRTSDIAYYLPTYTLIADIALQRFPELCERKGWKCRSMELRFLPKATHSRETKINSSARRNLRRLLM